jgi:hypothetical protein
VSLTDTKANGVKEILKAHVVRRGPLRASKAEGIVRSVGLLRQDQTISRSSTFRRIAAELGIESHRIGFGPGAPYVWRLKPPEWTSCSDQARELPDGRHD